MSKCLGIYIYIKGTCNLGEYVSMDVNVTCKTHTRQNYLCIMLQHVGHPSYRYLTFERLEFFGFFSKEIKNLIPYMFSLPLQIVRVM